MLFVAASDLHKQPCDVDADRLISDSELRPKLISLQEAPQPVVRARVPSALEPPPLFLEGDNHGIRMEHGYPGNGYGQGKITDRNLESL